MAESQFYKRLRNFFGIAIKDTGTIGAVAQPGKKRGAKKPPLAVEFPTEIDRLYQAYLSDVLDTSSSFTGRMDRYKDLEYAYYNNAIFSMAVELYADEAVQADAQSKVLNVYAKNKEVEKFIVDLFDRLDLSVDKLRSLAFDIALFSDHFWVLSTDEKEGITDITAIDPKSVTDRVEFNALTVKKQLDAKMYRNFMSKDRILTKLVQLVQNTTDVSHYFKNYLFGFQIENDLFVPPWNMIHFRRKSTKSEFMPFGRPLLINAISPFRQLQSSKNLMALARANSFPIKHFQVKVHEGMDESEQWEAVEDARTEFNNQGITNSEKEKFSVTDEIWAPEGLLSIDTIESRIDLNSIADIELLQDNLIMATRIPKGYLITDKGPFGQSGQSLLEQSKIFGRAVYTMQSAMLEGITELVKLQLVMLDKFEGENTEFEISLNFPVLDQDEGKLRMKNDTLRLASDVIENLAQAIGVDRDSGLPPNIIKQIFSKLSFLDYEDVNKWVSALLKHKEEMDAKDENGDEGENFAFESNNKDIRLTKPVLSEEEKKKVAQKWQRALGRINEEVIRNAYFKAKRDNRITEGTFAGKHFFSSKRKGDNECIYRSLNGFFNGKRIRS